MKPVEGCAFCLDNSLLEGIVIAKTERAYLIENIRIELPGAFLIVPVEHLTNILPGWWQAEINRLLPEVPQWEPGVSYNLSTNFGYDAGQRAPHLHTHVLLRTPRQGQIGLGTFIKEYIG